MYGQGASLELLVEAVWTGLSAALLIAHTALQQLAGTLAEHMKTSM